jgi:hypothetical protein
MVQKKITIKREQEAFLAACKNFGFADQSSLIRAALDVFIKYRQQTVFKSGPYQLSDLSEGSERFPLKSWNK